MEQVSEVGPYRIDREIGRGGMGVVYLAHDARLDRAVAIKALPEHLAADPDRLARFEREARSLAQLSHPNVAGIYGVEEHEGRRYLVLEYVEGETLADRLDRGPLPVEDALETCIEIARGLEAAHDAGIIHRDLKPANIKLTPEGGVKVLDFGLAKASGSAAGSSIVTEQSGVTMPTTPHSPTVPGAILGTAPYMSPEQARGRSVDKRSDIWSFGVILYECLTGLGPFAGETITDSIGAILHKDVDLALLPPDTPAQVRHVLRRCLQRDKAMRLRDIGDARLELVEALRSPERGQTTLGGASGSSARLARIAPWALAVLLALAGAYAAWHAWLTPEPEPTPLRFTIDLGAEAPIETGAGPHFALSPDGTALVFRTGSTLHVRRTDQFQAQPLKGTDGASHPFWSPDGQWIGFFQDNRIKKISVSGGAPLTLCDATGAHRGATWGDDGTIVFAPSTVTGLMRVPASGGVPEEITTPDREKKERSHRWPHFLPGATHILFTSQMQGDDFDDAFIEALDLETLERTVIHRGGAFPVYSTSGHLLFGRQATLYAAPFDPRTLSMLAPPEPVLAGVSTEPSNGGVHFSVSGNGTLAYNTGDATLFRSTIVKLDREGNATPIEAEDKGYTTAAISPDGTRLAIQLLPEGQTSYDVWIYEIARQVLSRLTFGEADEMTPTWSPDGNWIVYCATGDGFAPNLFMKRADGAGEPRRITESLNAQFPSDWTAHGNLVVFQEDFGETTWDIMTLRLDEEDAEPEVFIRTPFMEGHGAFSPDGKWLAYSSNESGRFEVYVRSFPGPGGRWQLSTEGGSKPFWSPDGSEIFYTSEGKSLYAVTITTTGDAISVGRPVKLHDNGPPDTFFHPQIGILPDGESFIALHESEANEELPQTSLEFVFNWFGELNRKAPRH